MILETSAVNYTYVYDALGRVTQATGSIALL